MQTVMQSVAYPYNLKTNAKTFLETRYNRSESRFVDTPADVHVFANKIQTPAWVYNWGAQTTRSATEMRPAFTWRGVYCFKVKLQRHHVLTFSPGNFSQWQLLKHVGLWCHGCGQPQALLFRCSCFDLPLSQTQQKQLKRKSWKTMQIGNEWTNLKDCCSLCFFSFSSFVNIYVILLLGHKEPDHN